MLQQLVQLVIQPSTNFEIAQTKHGAMLNTLWLPTVQPTVAAVDLHTIAAYVSKKKGAIAIADSRMVFGHPLRAVKQRPITVRVATDYPAALSKGFAHQLRSRH